jgi:GTP-binding protein
MIIKKVDLTAVAVAPPGYPTTGYPEIALAGRSNVGKSSLINRMLNRKSFARISGTPGKTRTINFYNVNDLLHIVDLPGYGYAKVSKVEKEKWGGIIETYLNARDELKMLVQLVDIRHEPTSDDKLMYNWIRQTKLPTVIVATKADKISKNLQFKNISVIKKALNVTPEDKFVLFSSETGQGRDELWEIFDSICAQDEEKEEE